MDFAQLESLLKSPKMAQDLFGDDPDAIYREWARICHPDRFATEADDVKDKAKSVFVLLEARFQELKQPPVIWSSTDFEYHLGPLLGKGEISNVHLATQKGAKGSQTVILKVSHVKEANVFLEKEAKVLTDLRVRAGDRKYSEYLPKPIELFSHEDRRVAIQQYYDGFYTLSEIMAKHPQGLDGRHVAWMFKRVLTVLGFIHAANVMHCAVLPMHVMFHAINHGCRLLSWANCVRSEQKLVVVPLAYKSWYPKSEISAKYPATPSLDIFLAAKSILELVKLDKSNSLPAPMLRFLQSCVVELPLSRPQDAWKLLEEWDRLLKKVYGPSKYVSLTM